MVCLVPARTDTAWWHDYAMKGKITFIRGRLKFGGQKNSAPFPSAVVVFEREAEAGIHTLVTFDKDFVVAAIREKMEREGLA